jgi:hypothetical protein
VIDQSFEKDFKGEISGALMARRDRSTGMAGWWPRSAVF